MNIVVISGSARPKRKSHQVALEVLNRITKRDQITSTLLDIKEYNFQNLDYVYKNHPSPTEQMKNFSETITKADGIIIVSPEHNGSYSGALKNTLDYFLVNFLRK